MELGLILRRRIAMTGVVVSSICLLVGLGLGLGPLISVAYLWAKGESLHLAVSWRGAPIKQGQLISGYARTDGYFSIPDLAMTAIGGDAEKANACIHFEAEVPGLSKSYEPGFRSVLCEESGAVVYRGNTVPVLRFSATLNQALPVTIGVKIRLMCLGCRPFEVACKLALNPYSNETADPRQADVSAVILNPQMSSSAVKDALLSLALALFATLIWVAVVEWVMTLR